MSAQLPAGKYIINARIFNLSSGRRFFSLAVKVSRCMINGPARSKYSGFVPSVA